MPPKQSGSSASAAPAAPAGSGIMGSLMVIHNSLPYFYYAPLSVVILWTLLYLCGVLRYLFFYYFLCCFISPHASAETTFFLFKRCFRPFKNYPITFGLTSSAILISRLFLIFPLETLFYYIDEIAFRGYKATQIKEPLLVLGQPRSGTTKFETILEGDEDLVCLKMWECRCPYLCVQYAVDLVCHIDARYLNGAIEKFIRDNKLMNALDETDGERAAMRRIRYDLSDEDDIIFLFHFFLHFQLLGAFPDPRYTHYLHHVDELSRLERRRMLEFHKRAVQKVMYRRGVGKRYFCKWVLSWCGVVQEAMQVYPDLKILVMTRNPEDQLKSWFKLQGLLSYDITGFNALNQNPEIVEELKKINRDFYNKEIEILQKLDPSRRIIFRFTDFYKDIQGNTKQVYSFLGKEIKEGSKFDKFLREQTQQQLTHKATSTDDKYISTEEIKATFPDLPTILFNLDRDQSAKVKEEGKTD